MVSKKITYPVEIFYDGSCIICSRETEHYKQLNTENKLIFIDISSDSFKATDYKKTQKQFMSKMHIRDASGAFFTGVDAIIVILESFADAPHLRLFGAILNLPVLNLVAKGYYSAFARLRLFLPKRKADDCTTDTCNLNHPRKL